MSSTPTITKKSAGKKLNLAEATVELDASAAEVAQLLGSISEAEKQRMAIVARISTLKKAKMAATRRLRAAEKVVFRGKTQEVDSGTRLRLEMIELGKKLMAALEVATAYFEGKPVSRGGPTDKEQMEAMALLATHGLASDLIWYRDDMENAYAARCITDDCAHYGRTLFNSGGYCRECEATHAFQYNDGPWDLDRHDGAENPAALLRRVEHTSGLSAAVMETRKKISDRFKLGLQI